jgi:hypothetical protein
VAAGDLNGDGNAEIVVGTQSQSDGVRVLTPDLQGTGVNFEAYNHFTGGLYVAVGRA